MQNSIHSKISAASIRKTKQLAVLIDPDKISRQELLQLIASVNINSVDYLMVGGSLLTGNFMNECIALLKEGTRKPVVLFPGNALQINPYADGILLLSLISGRNPELLIGHHIVAAPLLKQSGLEIISTGYMLIESGKTTSVQYMSNTLPIPSDKPEIAVSTALAGEMLGLKMIYMDAGSGALRPVPGKMIRQVKAVISVPLIIGGGIRCTESAQQAWEAGADIVVVGNVLEKKPEILEDLCRTKDIMNRIRAN
jgi:phosphoglycerol geranylgeranyltransferase